MSHVGQDSCELLGDGDGIGAKLFNLGKHDESVAVVLSDCVEGIGV